MVSGLAAGSGRRGAWGQASWLRRPSVSDPWRLIVRLRRVALLLLVAADRPDSEGPPAPGLLGILRGFRPRFEPSLGRGEVPPRDPGLAGSSWRVRRRLSSGSHAASRAAASRSGPGPGSAGLISNLSPSMRTKRALACSSWNGAEKATRWPSLPGSSVPSRRSRPAIAAAPAGERGQGLVGGQSGRDQGSQTGPGSCRAGPAHRWPAQRERPPCASAAAVATCSFHFSLR